MSYLFIVPSKKEYTYQENNEMFYEMEKVLRDWEIGLHDYYTYNGDRLLIYQYTQDREKLIKHLTLKFDLPFYGVLDYKGQAFLVRPRHQIELGNLYGKELLMAASNIA